MSRYNLIIDNGDYNSILSNALNLNKRIDNIDIFNPNVELNINICYELYKKNIFLNLYLDSNNIYNLSNIDNMRKYMTIFYKNERHKYG